MGDDTHSRIESEIEVRAFIQDLQYSLQSGNSIQFQTHRLVDEKRNIRYTNKYTVSSLFPDENPVEALKNELLKIDVANYIETVKDIRFPKRSEMRVFGKQYKGNEDVYIKVRVELLGLYGDKKVFVMSFHFAEKKFDSSVFPYRKS